MITRALISKLPNTPGVYLFFNEDDIPLYIGKSIAIRSRLLSHFRDATTVKKEQEIISRSVKIEVIETGGELGALLRESFLVKNLMPIYNRMLRRIMQVYALYYYIGKEGYYEVEGKYIDQADLSTKRNLLRTFSSQKRAQDYLRRKADEFSLCSKRLGLEQTKRNCFRYSLGRCFGACINAEDAGDYNRRFFIAFFPEKFVAWPFEGAVQLTETSATLSENFVISDWVNINSDKDLGYIGFTAWLNAKHFEQDQYKILKRFLLSRKTVPQLRLA